jgi:hypothetical protein
VCIISTSRGPDLLNLSDMNLKFLLCVLVYANIYVLFRSSRFHIIVIGTCFHTEFSFVSPVVHARKQPKYTRLDQELVNDRVPITTLIPFTVLPSSTHTHTPTHLFQHSCHCWKHLWKSSFGITCRLYVVLEMMSSVVSDCFPIIVFF